MSDAVYGTPVRTVQDLATRIESDPWLAEEMKNDPVKVMRTIGQSPLDTDKWIYRIVVIALGLAVLMAIAGGSAVILGTDREVPDLFLALGSAAVGALAGLLAPSPSRKQD
jgi:hypothetical protein